MLLEPGILFIYVQEYVLVISINGKNPLFRPQLGKQKIQLTIGEPIAVAERYGEYKTSRRQAVSHLTKDLETALS
ncbi:MAG: hypothetical protein D6756_12390 [Cyanobacteria bacterium J083]|nr:MAG: hypothetical protein D6756_12390 [Cyanobacteria bacterium J083]